MGDIALPYGIIMRRNLTVKGCYMYQRSEIVDLVGLVQSGLVSFEGLKVAKVPLENWEEGVERAAGADRYTSVAFVL